MTNNFSVFVLTYFFAIYVIKPQRTEAMCNGSFRYDIIVDMRSIAFGLILSIEHHKTATEIVIIYKETLKTDAMFKSVQMYTQFKMKNVNFI